jgi:Na+-driven multidrug efflux pump
MFVPTLLGALSICAVTTIDGIFVGQGTGSDGVAAVNIVVPIWMLFSGLELMVGAGCSVVASLHLSNNNEKAARLNVAQALLFTMAVSLLAIALIYIFPERIARMLGASETLMPQVLDYMLYISPCFLFQVWSTIGLFVIRLDGAPKYAMWCNVANAVTNAVLDWVFIFPLGMGVKGAAIATGISVVVGGVMAVAYLLFFARRLKPRMPKWSRKSLVLTMRNVWYQCRIGSSSLLGELMLAILFVVGNMVFMRQLGDDGVGAFGVACYYTPFVFMIGNSIVQSVQPILSSGYATGNYERVRLVRNVMVRTSVGFGVVFTLLFALCPELLVSLFIDPSCRAGVIAVKGLPLFATGFLFVIANLCIVGYYQSLERVGPGVLVMLLRGVVLLLPCFMLLPSWLGDAGIWLATPLAEGATVAVFAVFMLGRKLKNISWNTIKRTKVS